MQKCDFCTKVPAKNAWIGCSLICTKGRLSYHLYVECFSQLSFDSEVYTKSAAVADFEYTSESNERCAER